AVTGRPAWPAGTVKYHHALGSCEGTLDMDLSRDSGLMQEEQRLEERRPAPAAYAVEAEAGEPAPAGTLTSGSPAAPRPPPGKGGEKLVRSPEDDAILSRDLIDTYFRQMGGRELLSREGEIALAKRIEAAHLTLLKNLYAVPMVVGQIARWGEELRESTRSLRDVVDPSQSDGEPQTAAPPGGEAAAAHAA